MEGMLNSRCSSSSHNPTDYIVSNIAYHAGGPKVYDVSTYLDDHPGGAEVLLDVAGKDADEFFEDIGHSKEAREELKKHLIGHFKLDAAAIAAMEKAAADKKALQLANATSPATVAVFAVVAILLAVGYAMYNNNQKSNE
jgi:cytochrome b5